MRILVIEDDRDAADYLVKAFNEVGHVTDAAHDGEDGLAMASDGQYDILIVDRMLPKRDGLSVIGTLREKGVETPALILSALGQVDDRVKGLRAGGDDYLPKPYSFSELLARVEVLARRRGGRRPRARPAGAFGQAGQQGDRTATARIPVARISHEARRQSGDPHHAAGKRVGLSFRPANHRH